LYTSRIIIDISAAIAPEKQIKGWLRGKKLALIVAGNLAWDDLSVGWFDEDLS
jgi:putative endonuclease